MFDALRKETCTQNHDLSKVQIFLHQLFNARTEPTHSDVVEKIMEAGLFLMDAKIAFAGEFEENSFRIRFKLQNGFLTSFRLPLSFSETSFMRNMFERNLPYCSSQFQTDPFVPSIMKSFLVRNMIAIPINTGEECFGFLFSNIDGFCFSELNEGVKQLVEIFQLQVTGVLSDLAKQQKSKTDSETDELTRLLNRRALKRHLQEILRHKEPNESTMLLLVDIDHLKKINDTYGHESGDSAIQSVANCLKDLEDEKCKAFRIGGEEFVVLMNAVSPTASLRKAEDLQRKLSIFKMPNGSLTVSIGIAFFGPYATSIDELFKNADEALYKAKNAGRNRMEVSTLVEDSQALPFV